MFEVHDLSPRVGSEIRVNKHDLLSGKYAGEIDRLLKTRSALVFKRIGLSDAEQLQFARTLGEVNPLGDDGVSRFRSIRECRRRPTTRAARSTGTSTAPTTSCRRRRRC